MKNVLSAFGGLIKVLVIKLLHRSSITFDLYIKVAPSSRIELLSKGKICLEKGCSIGKSCELASVAGNLSIGRNVHIGDYGIMIARKEISIGENTMFGPHVYIFDHDHVVSDGKVLRDKFTTSSICIGKNVWVGANTVILKGTRIGDNCVIAAGSVVSGVVPDNSLFVQKRRTSVISNAKKVE